MIQSRKDYKQFKAKYEVAKKSSYDTFMFKGLEVLVAYAKYVIEYVETQKKEWV
jgi:hypothetical protein